MMTHIVTGNKIQRHIEIEICSNMTKAWYPQDIRVVQIRHTSILTHTSVYLCILTWMWTIRILFLGSFSHPHRPSHPNRIPPECQPVDAQDIDAKLCQSSMVTPDCASAADPTATEEVKNVEDRRLGSPWPWDDKPSSEIGAKTLDISLIALFIFKISKLQGVRFAACTSCSRRQSNQAGSSSYVIWSERSFNNNATLHPVDPAGKVAYVDRISGGPSCIICNRLALDFPLLLKTESPKTQWWYLMAIVELSSTIFLQTSASSAPQ